MSLKLNSPFHQQRIRLENPRHQGIFREGGVRNDKFSFDFLPKDQGDTIRCLISNGFLPTANYLRVAVIMLTDLSQS